MPKITRIDSVDSLDIQLTLDDGRKLRAPVAFTPLAGDAISRRLEMEVVLDQDGRVRVLGIVPGSPGSSIAHDDGLDGLARWLDEEYRRVTARPDPGGNASHYRAGFLAAVAEIAAIIRSGVLPAHSPVRDADLAKQDALAREDARMLGGHHAPVSDREPK